VLVLCLVLACAGSVQAQGDSTDEASGQEQAQEGEPETNEPPQEVVRRFRVDAWRMAHRTSWGRLDVFFVVEKMVDLSEKQSRSMEKLKEEYARGKGSPACRQKKCLHKVRRVLNKQQWKAVSQALEVLKRLREAQQEAAREFLQGADPAVRRKTDVGSGRINTEDLTRYMELPAPLRKELDRLTKEKHERVEKAMKGKEPPGDLNPKEKRQWRAREHRAARREAREWYENQRDVLLNQNQLGRLRKLEKAADHYRDRLRDAHKSCAAALQGIMLESAGYDVPGEDEGEKPGE
jgi:hypothetical protein